MKKLFLINYENAHWCGGQLNVVVWAHDEDEARELASDHMEQEQRELFADEYGDSVNGGDEEYEDEAAHVVNSVELFDENHEQWEFFQDPTQESFYPVIGKK